LHLAFPLHFAAGDAAHDEKAHVAEPTFGCELMGENPWGLWPSLRVREEGIPVVVLVSYWY
jgi:hypothetical protein